MNKDIVKLHDLLNETLALLDQACELVQPSGIEPRKESVKLIGMAVGEILQVRKYVYDAEPSLRVPGK